MNFIKKLFYSARKEKSYRMNEPDTITYELNWTKLGIGIGLIFMILILLVVLFNPFYIVKAGHRGVALRFGDVKLTPLEEGLHFLVPFIQATDVKQMSVQVKVLKTPADAASKDLQNVHSSVALNYHLIPGKVPVVYKDLGFDYESSIIIPQVQETFKATTAHYNATELITQRAKVRLEAKDLISERLKPYHIMVDDFAITNFNFDKEFASAIEAKQVAEIRVQTEKNNWERIKVEADQKITFAKGEAEAMRLKQLNVSELLIKWESVKKWDGQLPTFTGGAMPFIDISSTIKK